MDVVISGRKYHFTKEQAKEFVNYVIRYYKSHGKKLDNIPEILITVFNNVVYDKDNYGKVLIGFSTKLYRLGGQGWILGPAEVKQVEEFIIKLAITDKTPREEVVNRVADLVNKKVKEYADMQIE